MPAVPAAAAEESEAEVLRDGGPCALPGCSIRTRGLPDGSGNHYPFCCATHAHLHAFPLAPPAVDELVEPLIPVDPALLDGDVRPRGANAPVSTVNSSTSRIYFVASSSQDDLGGTYYGSWHSPDHISRLVEGRSVAGLTCKRIKPTTIEAAIDYISGSPSRASSGVFRGPRTHPDHPDLRIGQSFANYIEPNSDDSGPDDGEDVNGNVVPLMPSGDEAFDLPNGMSMPSQPQAYYEDTDQFGNQVWQRVWQRPITCPHVRQGRACDVQLPLVCPYEHDPQRHNLGTEESHYEDVDQFGNQVNTRPGQARDPCLAPLPLPSDVTALHQLALDRLQLLRDQHPVPSASLSGLTHGVSDDAWSQLLRDQRSVPSSSLPGLRSVDWRPRQRGLEALSTAKTTYDSLAANGGDRPALLNAKVSIDEAELAAAVALLDASLELRDNVATLAEVQHLDSLEARLNATKAELKSLVSAQIPQGAPEPGPTGPTLPVGIRSELHPFRANLRKALVSLYELAPRAVHPMPELDVTRLSAFILERGSLSLRSVMHRSSNHAVGPIALRSASRAVDTAIGDLLLLLVGLRARLEPVVRRGRARGCLGSCQDSPVRFRVRSRSFLGLSARHVAWLIRIGLLIRCHDAHRGLPWEPRPASVSRRSSGVRSRLILGDSSPRPWCVALLTRGPPAGCLSPDLVRYGHFRAFLTPLWCVPHPSG